MSATKTRGIVVVAVLAIFGGGFVAGRYRAPAAAAAGRRARAVLYYVDPMHPAYTSPDPGRAPDCGMTLVPVYEDESSEAGAAVCVTAAMQEAIGIRVAAVERAPRVDRLRVYGRVAADEARSYRVDAGLSGYMRELSAVTTGSRVQKDQWLATLSSPDPRSPFQGYLVALELLARSKSAGENEAQIAAAAATLELSIERLRTLGVSTSQLEEVARTKVLPSSIRILAPADGFVLARSVTAGQTVDRGHELYRIADIRRVWIMADVFGREAALVGPGMAATVRIPGRGEIAGARVSTQVLPQFDPATQSVRVRIEADNPGYVLRPDMAVDVDLQVRGGDALVVPADAVRDAGLEQLVFVERSGVFQPRRVKTGWRGGGRVEILDGLTPGERIAVSGAFLLDSESRLRHAGASKQSR
jgi:Cu(I)/Ag(I) efflux system membrane fusion protein